MRVHQSLNHLRAMTLCCTANRVNRPASIRKATTSGPLGVPSRVRRHAKVADETDGVQKRSQEYQVAETSVDEECDPLKHSLPPCLARNDCIVFMNSVLMRGMMKSDSRVGYGSFVPVCISFARTGTLVPLPGQITSSPRLMRAEPLIESAPRLCPQVRSQTT